MSCCNRMLHPIQSCNSIYYVCVDCEGAKLNYESKKTQFHIWILDRERKWGLRSVFSARPRSTRDMESRLCATTARCSNFAAPSVTEPLRRREIHARLDGPKRIVRRPAKSSPRTLCSSSRRDATSLSNIAESYGKTHVIFDLSMIYLT